MSTNNGQSAANPLLNGASSETILNGVDSSESKSKTLELSNEDIVQSLRKLKVVNSLYKITNTITNCVYIGITKRGLNNRFKQHMQASRKNNTFSRLHNAIRKYGEDNFKIELLKTYDTYEELLEGERFYIQKYRDLGISLYNILSGGRPLPNISNKSLWKERLRKKRIGRKPALNMKHTDNNKKLFSVCGKYRWDLYGRYPKEVINVSFKEAKVKYGISKTHYYRLLRQSKTNELT